ncbi:hypothetical protein DSL64_08005 [Dyadobacter luteus]|uniref:Lipoprotein n=1 Tax=Dyadobacter luteus TaxID=2259619 RepID=A0A3D8YF72_9BACT|nr:hypothetical protein [Dyadobacter luteus]REA62855.1 hypothetical protein DSL64_08005 [Dyadobacter luteus]
MNLLKTIGLCLMFLASISSCSRQSSISKANKIRLEDKMLSEKLQTQEKRADLLKLKDIISENIGVKNNHLIFRLSKKEFRKTGLPSEYYDRIQREIKANNDFIDANNLNADEFIGDGKFFPAEPEY